ncbi:MAG: diguanylate cyclase [Anaerolineales bacterium]|nr:diguanylate cyclase [Anaerolineales bacterium]
MKTLLFDDNSDDCLRITHELTQVDPDMSIVQVMDLRAFQEILDEGDFQLAITEFKLNWGNGLSVLIAIKNRFPDCPVIFFTGSGSEVIAVEAMKLGVDDYIPKTSEGFAHLGSAVEEVIEKTEQDRSTKLFSGLRLGNYEDAPIGLYRLSPDGVILEANNSLVRLLDYPSRDSILNTSLADHLTRPGDRAAWLDALQRGEELDNFEAQMKKHAGGLIWVSISAAAVSDGQGSVMYYEGTLKDVTKQVEETHSLHKLTERLGVLREIDQAILGTNSAEEIAKAALRRIQPLIPCERGSVAVFELDGTQATVFATYGMDKSPFGTGALILPESFGDIEKLRRGEVIYHNDLVEINNPPAWVESLKTQGIRSYLKVPLLSKGRLIGSLNLEALEPDIFNDEHMEYAQDIAGSLAIAIWQAKLTEQVHLLAITDELTGLYNRRQFFELGRREFDRAMRYNRPLSAIMLDLDHFKQINDTHGHAIGDQVLRVVARRCKKEVRDIDILGRYGGEEFAILLPETHLDFGQVVAERLRKQMSNFPIITDRQTLQATVSLGVAQASSQTSSIEALLEQADAAMYHAKQSGRDRVAVFQSQPG